MLDHFSYNLHSEANTEKRYEQLCITRKCTIRKEEPALLEVGMFVHILNLFMVRILNIVV